MRHWLTALSYAGMACASVGGLSAPRAALVEVVPVYDIAGLRQALAQAAPGVQIRVAPGNYTEGIWHPNLRGEPGKYIVICAADPKNPPIFEGGWHLPKATYVELRDLVFHGTTYNGLNIDDGGEYTVPARHIVLRNLRVSDAGKNNGSNGIKLSGVDEFRIENCTIERWDPQGCAIDMVGCHKGTIVGCVFSRGGGFGIQAKGGSSDIVIEECRFEDYGGRGVNIGGSTGFEYFRPPLATFPANGKYEARNIRVERNLFVGGTAAVAYVGVDGALVRSNTIYHPQRWALRILQETREPGFVSSRSGVFEDNIVVFRSDTWYEGGVNIGPDTAPETFRFARNVWYCEDRPDRSRPTLPSAETDAVIGKDPGFMDPARGDFMLRPGSPAAGRGAHPVPARK